MACLDIVSHVGYYREYISLVFTGGDAINPYFYKTFSSAKEFYLNPRDGSLMSSAETRSESEVNFFLKKLGYVWSIGNFAGK